SSQENAINSPLLRLPGEIRNKIFHYALCDYKLEIHNKQSLNSPPSYNYIQPRFQLPRVCRQIHAETAPIVYSRNTFGFDTLQAMDRWIRNRTSAQLELVTSINVPFEYMRLYNHKFRKTFKEVFPNTSALVSICTYCTSDGF
ncbi:hypothetical protein CC80DRAFT_581879, partial [Byssothecium circinans]